MTYISIINNTSFPIGMSSMKDGPKFQLREYGHLKKGREMGSDLTFDIALSAERTRGTLVQMQLDGDGENE
jgi:hypothetical protein